MSNNTSSTIIRVFNCFFIALILLTSAACTSVGYDSHLQTELQSINLIIFNNTTSAYCNLKDSVHLTLNKTASVSYTDSNGTPVTITSLSLPAHPGDKLTIIIPGGINRISTYYIKLFEQSLKFEKKEDYHVKFTLKNGSASFSYSPAYVLEYQVPDVDTGEYIVSFCGSKNDSPIISGYGYLEIAEKGDDY